jgi:FlaA1/EpsC-like NDP-sugar epimerase
MKRLAGFFRTRAAIFAHDLLMILLAWLGAYWLRFNLEAIPATHWRQALLLLPVVWLSQGAMFWYFGLYRGIWRFASIPDLMRIMKAVAAGLLVAATVSFLLTRLEDVPRSVFVFDGILLVFFLGGPRFAYRWWKDRHLYHWLNDRRITDGDSKRALIVGAGMAGEMLARDMLRDHFSPFRPVAFVDDDRKKAGKEIHGLPVVGDVERLPELVERYGAELILIALPSATSRQIRRVVEICEGTGLPFRTLPRMQDIVSGQATVKDLRNVKIEDLLGREPVKLDWEAIGRGISGKTVLVTGGGGSIGAELSRQIARLKPARLVVFEQSEYNLYSIELELRNKFTTLPLATVLGDVCDAVAVEHCLTAHKPNVIFHAAAYKHVPLLEDQVRPAVANNIFGTRTVATLASRLGCESFVLISTDKAVNPGNIMGVTKRIAEMLCQDLNARTRTRFITVRFGNVLGSSGSVVPLFQEQIARGGPVTVTHPEVTRYFMTIPEACQLILQAGAIGKGGEIFALDMGEPVKIAYLAEQLIRLSGKTPGEDVEIVYTGLRPGEKLFEELFHDAEKPADTGHPKIHLARCRQVDAATLEKSLSGLATACQGADAKRILELLSELVPEGVQNRDSGGKPERAAVIYPWKGTHPGR